MMDKSIGPILYVFCLLGASNVIADVAITSLPFTANINGETYHLSSDLTSNSGTAITVSGSDITLDGGNSTIRYAENGPGNAIVINSSSSNIAIRNFNIIQGNYDPVDGENVNAVYLSGNHAGIVIADNSIEVNHSGTVSNAYGYGIDLRNNWSPSTGNEISGNHIAIHGSSAGKGINIDPSSTWSGTLKGNTISMYGMSRLPAGYPRAIALGSNRDAPVTVDNNTITLGGGCDGIQGISLWNGDGATIVNNNVIMNARNARGILIDGDSDNNLVISNRVKMNSQDASLGASAGIRIRFGSDNTVVINNSVDGTDSVYSFGLRLGGAEPSLPQPIGSNISNNTFISPDRAISIEDSGQANIYNNTITSNGGYAAFFYGVEDDNANQGYNQNITFSGNIWTGRILFGGESGILGSDNIKFCNADLDHNDIVVAAGIHNYTLESALCITSNAPPSAPMLF